MMRLIQAKSGICEQRHAAAAHAENRRDDIGRRSDGAESADQYAENPIVRAVPFRECPGGQRSISKPADIWRTAGAGHSFTAN